MICRDCPIDMAYTNANCFWLNGDGSCLLKAEHEKHRKQAEDDHKIADNMRSYWTNMADGAER